MTFIYFRGAGERARKVQSSCKSTRPDLSRVAWMLIEDKARHKVQQTKNYQQLRSMRIFRSTFYCLIDGDGG